ncbi:NUDIX domain-containing protein [Candidatus Microgenomates bacterium]|nr:NUDIX domain-containing protein [Candidatus Microgenomates bacterium]
MKKGVDFVGVRIGAVIINKQGKIFLSLRGRKARNDVGKWECPGGALEFGDRMEETIIREIKEEFGFDIEVIEQMDAVDHLIPAEKQHWVAIAYLCKIKKGKPKILEPHKCAKIGWFTIGEMDCCYQFLLDIG